MFEFQDLTGTVEVFSPIVLPEFSHATWYDAREAGHIEIKSIEAIPSGHRAPGTPYFYRVHFNLESFSPKALAAVLTDIAARTPVLEPSEI